MMGYCSPKREVSRFSVHVLEPNRFVIMIPRSEKAGAFATAFSVADFERQLKHDRRAQRQGADSYDGPHGHLILSKYIPEKLRCCVRDDGLVVEVSSGSQVDPHADGLTHAIQGAQMFLRSG